MSKPGPGLARLGNESLQPDRLLCPSLCGGWPDLANISLSRKHYAWICPGIAWFLGPLCFPSCDIQIWFDAGALLGKTCSVSNLDASSHQCAAQSMAHLFAHSRSELSKLAQNDSARAELRGAASNVAARRRRCHDANRPTRRQFAFELADLGAMFLNTFGILTIKPGTTPLQPMSLVARCVVAPPPKKRLDEAQRQKTRLISNSERMPKKAS